MPSGWGPHNDISALLGRDQIFLSIHTQRVGQVSTWRVGLPQANRNKPTLARALILDFPASRTIRKEFLLLKLPSLCYFVMAAGADRDKWYQAVHISQVLDTFTDRKEEVLKTKKDEGETGYLPRMLCE